MIRDQLLQLLRQSPFQPFQVRVQDGRTFEVRHPRLAMVGRDHFHVGIPEPGETRPIADHVETFDMVEVVGADLLSKEESITAEAQREHLTINQITEVVIGAAIEVHRHLGPGLLESAYQECLARELTLRQVPHEPQRPLPLEYKGVKLECGYRLDFLVDYRVVVEVKAVESLHPIHEAQLITYLKLGGWKIGLLINFNVPVLKDGIRRRVLNLEE